MFVFPHIPSVRKSGYGLLPANSIWQGAGVPATSQMRCWLLPNGRIFPAAAGLLCVGLAYCACVFSHCPHVGATLAFPVAPHTHSLSGQKPHTAATRASRRRTVPAAKGCKDANCSRCYPLTLLLWQAPEPLVGAALRKNAEISLCDFQRPL